MLDRLWVKNFRNLSEQLIGFDPRFTVISGENNQGKTNFLEAIYFALNGVPLDESLIGDLKPFNVDECGRLGVDIAGESIFRFYREISASGGRSVSVNGVKRHQNDISRRVNCVYLSADILRSLQDSPDMRRKFLDRFVMVLDGTTHDLYRTYSRVLAQRNAALKRGSYELVRLYNRRFVELSEKTCLKRVESMGKILPIVQRIFGQTVGDESVVLEYRPLYRDVDFDNYCENLFNRLEENYDKERRLGYTLVGAHRDDFDIYVNGQSAIKFLSRGINRLLSIICTISAVKSSRESGDVLLLLDDAFAEISDRLKLNLMRQVLQEFQVVYTSTVGGEFPDLNAKRYIMINGKLIE